MIQIQNKKKHESFILKQKIENEFNGSAEKLFLSLASDYKNYFLNELHVDSKLLKNYQNIANHCNNIAKHTKSIAKHGKTYQKHNKT